MGSGSNVRKISFETRQIEAIFNSRPLYTTLDDDPMHIDVLIPAHFKIGDFNHKYK